MGLPSWHSGRETACQCRRWKRSRFNPLVGKTLWKKKCQPISVFTPEKSHRQRNLLCYSPWGCKKSDITDHTHKNTYTHKHFTHRSLDLSIIYLSFTHVYLSDTYLSRDINIISMHLKHADAEMEMKIQQWNTRKGCWSHGTDTGI